MRCEILISLLYISQVFSAPAEKESFVTVSTETEVKTPNTKDNVPKVPNIYSIKVDTNVTNRFATSQVVSKVKNLDANPQEATFSFVLPDTAYITGFTMEIDGKKYKAYIQEKDAAKKTYDEAVSSGFAAGHVAVNARDSNKFTVSVNIMPESKATFYLTYEELLSRQKELYDVVINLHPGQLVKDIEVRVNINETRPLTSVTVPSLRSGNELSKNNEIIDPKAEIERIGNNAAIVTFKPDTDEQKEFAKELGTVEENGFAGQFVVQYDVERDPHGGELLFADGYFVHFFSPKDAIPEPKYIIFVLDTSGSMYGKRITQLKKAMKSILDQLKAEDSFNIIDFNSLINVWDVQNSKVQYQEGEIYSFLNNVKISRDNQVLPSSFEMSGSNIENAKQIVDSLQPSGGTNAAAALDVALKLHKNNKLRDERQPMIMFLTDGHPTDSSADQIVSKVSKENTEKIPVITISLGDQADKSFLEKLSLKNQGISRHIYEGADADLQLKSFYEIISTPLFNNINFKYVKENITEVTKTEFPILYKGSELVVAGKYKSPVIYSGFPPHIMSDILVDLPIVQCHYQRKPKEFSPTLARPIGSLEKHWAYLTLKQLLQERDAADKKEELTKKALDLALKYSFVTPVSSLVVVKPNDTKSVPDLEDASKGDRSPEASYSLRRLPSYSTPRYPAPHFVQQRRKYTHHSSNIMLSQRFDQFSSAPSFAPAVVYSMNIYPTPFASLPQTTERPKSNDNDTIEKLKLDLPWFGSLYNAANGTISLPQGEFLIGKDDTVVPQVDCPKTPINENGNCVLLINCPQVHRLLPLVSTYNQFFCPLGKYAGVCCPKPEVVI